MRLNRALIAAAMLALAAVGIGASSGSEPTRFGQIDDARMKNWASEPQNWLMHSGNQQAWRYSSLDQINVSNVGQLKPAWSFEFDTDRGQEATPIVVDGVAYVSTAWSKVYALNAKTGEQLWYYDPKGLGEAGPRACCDVVNRGVSVYKGKVYLGALDGRVIALDARTGKPVWSTQTIEDPDSTLSVTSTPQVARGIVWIGNAGGDFGGRGYVTALDAETGKKLWRFFLTPGKPGVKDHEPSDEIMDKVVQPTWFGPANDYRGGANVWNALVYDPEFDQVYLATGDGFPWNRYFRSEGKGDNLFIASVVALDARTGKYKWHYQETPGESWDLDAVADMILMDLKTPTGVRKALIHTPKAGLFYELDRKTGQVISGVPFVPGVNWTTGLDPKTGRPIMNPAVYYDNKTPIRVNGFAHSWQPTSYDPKTGWVYLQASQGPPGTFTPKPVYNYVKHIDNLGVFVFGQGPIPAEELAATPPVPKDAVARRSYLMAWDPVKQKAVWQTDGAGGGVLTTGGNLVFQGAGRNVMGTLNAFRADTGQKVWSYNTPNSISTGPVTYMIDGEQYIMVSSGAGLGIMGGTDIRARQPGRLLVFKLNGTATLPPDPPPAAPIKAIPADFPTLSAADYAWATNAYAETCAHCHGVNGRNNGVVPDLRRSNVLLNKDGWAAIVEGGLLKDNGMISWTHFLPPGGAEKIRLYIADEAKKASAAPAAAPRPGTAAAPPTEFQGGL